MLALLGWQFFSLLAYFLLVAIKYICIIHVPQMIIRVISKLRRYSARKPSTPPFHAFRRPLWWRCWQRQRRPPDGVSRYGRCVMEDGLTTQLSIVLKVGKYDCICSKWDHRPILGVNHTTCYIVLTACYCRKYLSFPLQTSGTALESGSRRASVCCLWLVELRFLSASVWTWRCKYQQDAAESDDSVSITSRVL